ncbi:AEC family transporter [Christensenellaceae bacterium OttesenSCG-928-M15]|nr:AEC family transporter [Christensenellaceae bacterium OttesenSCG-928-M15]
MVATIVFKQMITLFIIMLSGYIATKAHIIDAKVSKGLSALLTKILLPAFVINSLQVPYSPENASMMGISVLGLVISMALGLLPAFLITKLKRMKLSEAGVIMCCCTFSNFIFLGKPIMNAIYGEGIDFQMSSMGIAFNILVFTAGIILVTLDHKETLGAKAFLKYLINPTVIAGFIGLLLFFFSIRLPEPVLGAFSMLGNTLTPLSMIIIGHSLVGVNLKQMFLDWRVYLIAAIRLLICPTLTYFLIRNFISDPIVLGVVVIASAMPVAASAGLICEEYESPHKLLVSKSIVVTTILCLFSAPLMVAVLGL